MSEQKQKPGAYEQYCGNLTQAHLFLAVILLLVGGFGLWMTLDYFDQAREHAAKIMIDDANPAIALCLLLALIPLGLEFAYRRNSFIMPKKLLIALMVGIGVVLVVAHGLGGLWLARELTNAGYEHCEKLDRSPRHSTHSSRGRDAWVPQGCCLHKKPVDPSQHC